MATTRTYLDYLNEKVDISPANSQEELDEAKLIEGLMLEHGLDVKMQEFEANGAAGVARNAVYLVLFVGMLLVGILGTPVSVIGFLLVIAVCGLLFAERNGRPILRDVGPRVQSQNVIGVHRASGPLVERGNRPIVVVAHYDSPNENVLYQPQFARYQTIMRNAELWCVALVAICSLLQVIGIIPALARHIFWVVGILASLIPLSVAIADSYEHWAPATTGANDNKAAVAALLGLMDLVHPAEDEAKRYMELHPRAAEPEATDESDAAGDEDLDHDADFADDDYADGDESADDYADAPADDEDAVDDVASDLADEDAGEKNVASASDAPVDAEASAAAQPEAAHKPVRRGPDFMHSLNILPEDCEIVYQKPPRPKVTLPEIDDAELAGVADSLPVINVPVAPAPAADADFDAEDEPQSGPSAFFSRLFKNKRPKAAHVDESVDDGELPPFAEFEVIEEPSAEETAAAPVASEPSAQVEQDEPAADTGENAAQDVLDHVRGFFGGMMDRLAGPIDDEPIDYAGPADEPAQDDSLGETNAQAPATTSAMNLGETVAMDAQDEVAEKDASGLDVVDADSLSVNRPSEPRVEPNPVDDADWGKSDFSPATANGGVARRAALFDLPDPSALAVDPLASDDAVASEPADENPDQQPIDFIMGQGDPLAGDDADDKRGRSWKGGATTRSDLRGDEPEADEFVDAVDEAPAEAVGYELGADPAPVQPEAVGYELGAEEQPAATADADSEPVAESAEPVDEQAAAAEPGSEGNAAAEGAPMEDLREAILGMSDDELLCHDIWFIAAGSSSLDHAGVKSFLKEHRRDIRGAFLVNLDSIGAGDLTLLTNEGVIDPRRADRRIGKLLLRTADNLHIDLGRMRYDWSSTDATPAMRASVRSATIMGVDDAGLPAFSHTQEDVAENVDASQVVKVVDLIAEFIRRA